MKRAFLCCVVGMALFAGGGCTHYYKVHDVVSNKIYYTDDYEDLRSGSVRFKDVVTQQQITLSSSEVIPITKSEYKANINNR